MNARLRAMREGSNHTDGGANTTMMLVLMLMMLVVVVVVEVVELEKEAVVTVVLQAVYGLHLMANGRTSEPRWINLSVFLEQLTTTRSAAISLTILTILTSTSTSSKEARQQRLMKQTTLQAAAAARSAPAPYPFLCHQQLLRLGWSHRGRRRQCS